jgi:gluconate 5-dehydrogenase
MGRAIADAFEDDGRFVYRLDQHRNTRTYRCDLTSCAQIRDILNEVTPPIQVLVNCAGVSLPGSYGDLDYWDATFAVNVRAIYYLSSLVAPLMTEGGSIINITSLNAHQGFGGNPAYVSSKSALRGLTKAMALDWAPLGIRVNNVVPGYIATDMTKRSYNDPWAHQERAGRTMLDKWGKPSDVVGAVLFLASEAASYITGTDLVVDGGWLAKGL